MRPLAVRLLVGCAMLAACAVLAGCGEDGVERAAKPAGTGAAAGTDGYPVTLRNCGKSLTFDRAPSRAVLPYHPMAEILVGLGLADRAVGRTGYKGALEEPPLLPEQAADFKRIKVVSDTNFPPPKERMLALRPDFLFTYGEFDYGGKHEGAEGLASRGELRRAGAEVYTVVCPDDAGKFTGETLAATYRSILDIGRIFGVSERAQERVAQMKRQIAEVKRRVAGEPEASVIAYGGGTGPLSLAGGRTIISEIIDAAGGRNVFADRDPFFEASLEAVAAKQADAFLIFADSEEATADLDATDEQRFLFKTFPNMKASRERRTAVTDYVYTSPGWRVAQTVEDIARQLHPGAFDAPSETRQHTDRDGGG